MQPISFDDLCTRIIDSNARLYTKNHRLYQEVSKPSLFQRLWRYISGKYDKCKIAQCATEILLSKADNHSLKSTNLLANVTTIIQNIGPKNKCQETAKKLYSRLKSLYPDYDPQKTEQKDVKSIWEAEFLKQGELEDGEAIEQILNEPLYDLLGCPSFMGSAVGVLAVVLDCQVRDNQLVHSKYRCLAVSKDLRKILETLTILTPSQCIEKEIAPDFASFKKYFAAHREEFISKLLAARFLELK